MRPDIKIRRQKNREYILSKRNVPCADCGQTFPVCCMEFHHLDEETKLESLKKRGKGFLDTMSKYSIKRIDEEMDKCVILCSNCHKIRHWV